MLTVTVGLDASGNNRTLKPLGSSYSVIPSIDVIRFTPGTSAEAAARKSDEPWQTPTTQLLRVKVPTSANPTSFANPLFAPRNVRQRPATRTPGPSAEKCL